jgi:hypothetical protein
MARAIDQITQHDIPDNINPVKDHSDKRKSRFLYLSVLPLVAYVSIIIILSNFFFCFTENYIVLI